VNEELKPRLADLLARLETGNPSEALDLIIAASKQGDAALGAATRKLMPLIGLALLAASWGVTRQMNKVPKGRPRSGKLGDRDCWRAYSAWRAVKVAGGITMSNQEAIALCREIDVILQTREEEQAFSSRACAAETSLEQSLSRGRTKLGMDDTAVDRWKSAACEDLFKV
jgi:hypothetical protein